MELQRRLFIFYINMITWITHTFRMVLTDDLLLDRRIGDVDITDILIFLSYN